MHADFCAFGEILWDCLPSGKHAGGAPFNVAAHLAQLGASAALISAVGLDSLGDEILQVAADKNVDTRFVRRARIGLGTGTVLVTLDENSNASYELVQPSAWDEITVCDAALAAVADARALIFGSLAGRSPCNRQQLDRLLGVEGPMKFFDVNLRPPFADPVMVMEMAGRAHLLKVNDDELGQLVSWIRTGEMSADTPCDERAVGAACALLAERTKVPRICVTRGADGAAMWEDGTLTCAPAPSVTVRDTVGAGDAFMAGLMIGITSGGATREILAAACKVGAYVASHHGATPLLPAELVKQFQRIASAGKSSRSS